MPPTLPTPSLFHSLTLTITPPPKSPSTSTQPHSILLLLHGQGDTHLPFTTLASQLNLPECAILSLRAPHPLPFSENDSFQWGEDLIFDSSTGTLDPDTGFGKSIELLRGVIGTLVKECGYAARDVHILGYGQGGMLALGAAVRMERGMEVSVGSGKGGEDKVSKETGEGKGGGSMGELGGITSVGGVLSKDAVSVIAKNRTPVLLVGGREGGGRMETVVTEGEVERIRSRFEFVEIKRYRRGGDGMPRDRDEMRPLMEFWGRRMRSWRGVPGGVEEVGF